MSAPAAPRYLVGVDLGTTHTVVAYAGVDSPGQLPRLLPIPQLVAPGAIDARPLLPSARYHPAVGEIATSEGTRPWLTDDADDPVTGAVVGALAQALGAGVPGRLVASAKSWLSHPGVDRSAPILPWGAPDEVARISPVDASASYLRHVRRAWNAQFPDDPLEDQDVVLTVPASFDESARHLTVEAARRAGLSRIRLVEEPQAACYDWLARHADALEEALDGVRTLLVCDVGGGTTDLTLIRVDWRDGRPALVRVGVGDHLMLGGDNMDIALAHLVEQRLPGAGERLSAAQLSQLVQQCRGAKERLLAPSAPEAAAVTLLGAGARLVGQARTTQLGRAEVEQLVVDGFFPEVGPDERPLRRRGGIVEFGLPYAADAAVTRHLGAFLANHARTAAGAEWPDASPGGSAMPDAVLLNGGVFRSAVLAHRLLEVLEHWRGSRPRQLRNDDPDLAVARGAVAYGLARRGRGIRIGGGAPRSLLLPVDGGQGRATRAVCVVPRGTEEGRELRLADRVFSLRLGEPVRVELVTTSSNLTPAPGQIVDIDPDDLRRLPPLVTVLSGAAAGSAPTREVPVELAATLTDIGTLELECVATGSAPEGLAPRWRMEFQVRGGTPMPDASAPALPMGFARAAERIRQTYGARDATVDPKASKQLARELESLLGDRSGWDTRLLRALFDVLWEGARRRRRSADHERLWLNLAGFCLRPGYGYPLDDWRVQGLWSLYEQGVQYRDEPRNRAEWWTTWRRVAGGLDTARQERILRDVEDQLARPGQRAAKDRRAADHDHLVRLVATLERLPAARKAQLGQRLLEGGRRPGDSPQRWWALGRLGARVPFHGHAHEVVPREVAAAWLEQVLALDWAAVAAPATWATLVEQGADLDSADQSLVFGESLPPGLRLVD